MIYTIEPKPTTYSGVKFRSRLEAQWAAMFDIIGLKWEYEPPIDFAGWFPDFRITTQWCPVFVEVKPTYDFSDDGFDKARNHWQSAHILMLGAGPLQWFIGALLDAPSGANYNWADVNDEIGAGMRRNDIENAWRTAGNEIRR